MTAAPLADLLANSGPRVTFWQCIIRTHSQRRGVVTVERDEDGTARCTYPGCEVTSVETTRYARAVAEVATEQARAELAALADERDALAIRLAEVTPRVPVSRPTHGTLDVSEHTTTAEEADRA